MSTHLTASTEYLGISSLVRLHVMYLRYYGRGTEDRDGETIDDLLDALSSWDIELEFQFTHELDEAIQSRITDYDYTLKDETQMWEDDFAYNRSLSNNLGNESPADKFKTNSNNTVITGALAIIDGGVQNALKYSELEEFLDDLEERGPDAIDDRYGVNRGTPHDELLRALYDERVFGSGDYHQEYSIGKSLPSNEDLQGFTEKYVDLYVEAGSTIWIAEVKPEVTASEIERGLGQLFLYKDDQKYLQSFSGRSSEQR